MAAKKGVSEKPGKPRVPRKKKTAEVKGKKGEVVIRHGRMVVDQ